MSQNGAQNGPKMYPKIDLIFAGACLEILRFTRSDVKWLYFPESGFTHFYIWVLSFKLVEHIIISFILHFVLIWTYLSISRLFVIFVTLLATISTLDNSGLF